MGLLAGWFAHKADPGQIWRLFFTTGILGGFTTFSSFSLETRRALCFSFSSSLAFGSFSGSRHNPGYELGE
jgi:fluoride ion exporter CrcB/FEX